MVYENVFEQTGAKMKRIMILIICVSIIGILSLSGFLILNLLNDDMKPPELPVESEENYLTITSNGCCFHVTDMDVWMRNEKNEDIRISHNEKVYGNDIFKHEIPDSSESDMELIVKFRSFYGDECEFSLPVMQIENIDELKKTGILLYFQEYDDMYLHVIAGDYHVSYKRGKDENRWTITDVPNKVYS